MRILLAEDEAEMSRALVAVMKHSGYEVDAVYDGLEATEKAKSGMYDCMVLDIMMPKLDGIEALRQIRETGDTTPVIMLTAKAEIDDRITGLDAGADDYLTKPFSMKELLARIRSMTRRSGTFSPKLLQAGNVTLNTEEQELSGGSSVRLAGKEAKLMEFLMQNQGKELSTEGIFHHVWKNDEEAEEDVVWVYISYLRQKLKSINANIRINGEQGGSFSIETKN